MSQNKQANLQRHRSFVLWLTSFSGAGKSTIASAVAQKFMKSGEAVHILDGDIVRKSLCANLSYTDTDREENIRRISEIAKLALDSGSIVLTALISPKQAHRQQARNTFKK